jgi:hypothetical protein
MLNSPSRFALLLKILPNDPPHASMFLGWGLGFALFLY